MFDLKLIFDYKLEKKFGYKHDSLKMFYVYNHTCNRNESLINKIKIKSKFAKNKPVVMFNICYFKSIDNMAHDFMACFQKSHNILKTRQFSLKMFCFTIFP